MEVFGQGARRKVGEGETLIERLGYTGAGGKKLFFESEKILLKLCVWECDKAGVHLDMQSNRYPFCYHTEQYLSVVPRKCMKEWKKKKETHMKCPVLFHNQTTMQCGGFGNN